MKHIELFAGCGGLCLGLKKAGFDLFFANELSPMAAETFAYNLLGEDLSAPGGNTPHTIWIKSSFPSGDKRRLREDPRTYPDNWDNCGILPDGSNISGSLLIGNINSLLEWLEGHPQVAHTLRNTEIDLMAGGPPCQSFSLAGLREKNNEKNLLPWSFARLAAIIRPQTILLENVTGILRPFSENGEKYYAWLEVSKAFASIGYVPLPLHVNAKYVGVAQNRPRFILVGVREDIFTQLAGNFNPAERFLFRSSQDFYASIKKNRSVTLSDITIHDLNKEDPTLWNAFQNSFLSSLAKRKSNYVSVKEAIGDLEEMPSKNDTKYVKYINETFSDCLAFHPQRITGLEKINVTHRVMRRYRIYQILSSQKKLVQKQVQEIISGKRENLSQEVWNDLCGYKFLMEDGNMNMFSTINELEDFIKNHKTRKQVQKALLPEEPAPAALSIPDDACHYKEIRTLTVREMARIQSFPDSFCFRSKTTTGGLNRRYEVPIYTQIGNAVPVLLAYALGTCMNTLLKRINHG
ncbi:MULTISPECIES: DNA (cytosine-5-)-methyltransferase [unclassified Desulfovibrio]|uniref:DNA cytosine methyltransferase n=1 Tax=unclassified Desulfovibrio TaxID=2593640 RepID=UPI0013EAA0EC|nr:MULTISPECIES: DNA (cytosine-5-)-methyltransferase [unclassified Desulfovibrio]